MSLGTAGRISSNQVENAIRPFVVGRKRWLFANTPQGAEATAIICSLLETAKANNEVMVPGRVSAGNHDVSIPRDD